MTIDTIGQFLSQYWGLLAFLGGVSWILIKQLFDVKNMKKDMVELKTHMDHHDMADKEVERNITNLINRNKDATEATAKTIQDKLEHIGNSIIRMDTTIKYYMNGKSG